MERNTENISVELKIFSMEWKKLSVWNMEQLPSIPCPASDSNALTKLVDRNQRNISYKLCVLGSALVISES